MKLAFILGHIPALSLAEIHAVFSRMEIGFTVLAWNPGVLLADVEGSDVQSVFPLLSGVVKIAEITASMPHTPGPDEIRALLPQTARKIFFGISAYELESGAERVSVKRLGLAVKRVLEEEGRSSRFVTSQEDALSAVVISTNKLLSERGAEVIVVSVRDGAYLGRTVWVQPYDEYAKRDMGRPMRDARSGMLPPKLARMMVNLAIADRRGPISPKLQPATPERKRGERDESSRPPRLPSRLGRAEADSEAGLPSSQINTDSDFVLLDPFCGSGTVLQEASLLNVPKLIGTDQDGSAIKRTHANLQWLATMTPTMRSSSYSLTLKLADVKMLPHKVGECMVDAIVTEPYLGPPRTEPLSDEEAGRMQREIGALYRDAFRAFASVLKPGGRVVIVWPVWRTGRCDKVFLERAHEREATGFTTVDPLLFPINPMPGEEEGYLHERHSLLYQRADQYVLREIKIFTKV